MTTRVEPRTGARPRDPRAVALPLRRPAAGVLVAALLGLPPLTACQPPEPEPRAAVLVGPGGAGAPAPPATPALPWVARPAPAGGTATAATTPSSTTSSTVPAVTPGASPALASGPCLPLYGPGTPVPVDVTVSGGGAVVLSWWHNGDPATISYWVGAWERPELVPVTPATGGPATASGTPPPVVWTRLAPPAGCREVSFTIRGLLSGRTYALLLDLEARTPETWNGISRVSLAHVPDVRMP